MNTARVVRILSLLSLASGVAAIIQPQACADFVGLAFEVGNPSGYGEVGALYGGNFVALGLIGLYAARASVAAGPALLVAIGVVWLGIGGGRLLTILFTSPAPPGVMGWGFLAMELTLGVTFIICRRTSADS
ncbi:MAG: DUF4345 family protein [Deltaproteobacteria bacterium]